MDMPWSCSPKGEHGSPASGRRAAEHERVNGIRGDRVLCISLWRMAAVLEEPTTEAGLKIHSGRVPIFAGRQHARERGGISMARLLSVNVGLPRDIEWRGRTVHTGIWKEPVRGRRPVTRLNVEGDGQGDLDGHGGEQRAVYVYQIESYRYWEERLGRSGLVHGQFGENFTIEGLPDDAVCIGDCYRIGTA